MKLNIDIVKYRNLWFAISGALLLASLFFVVQSFQRFGTPVLLGLDFTGGTKLEYKFSKSPVSDQAPSTNKKLDSESLQAMLANLGLEGSSVQISRDEEPVLIIRTRAISDEPVLDRLNYSLEMNYGKFEVLSVDTVSPIVGPELLSSGLIALLATIIGMIIYISFRFKSDYAACAVAALFHDVFIVIGLFAFLGLQYGIEVNSLFITALLTVFGFSVHDTIVVFDRIRENQKLQTRNFSFDQVANVSVNQVVVRSINTSLTVLFTLACLFFFGGVSTKDFVGALFVGMFAGTYSSIFIASPLLVMWRGRGKVK